MNHKLHIASNEMHIEALAFFRIKNSKYPYEWDLGQKQHISKYKIIVDTNMRKINGACVK